MRTCTCDFAKKHPILVARLQVVNAAANGLINQSKPRSIRRNSNFTTVRLLQTPSPMATVCLRRWRWLLAQPSVNAAVVATRNLWLTSTSQSVNNLTDV